MKNTAMFRVPEGRTGSVLVPAILLLTVAAVAGGAVMTASMTYARQSEMTYRRERAALLADAGLRAAAVTLNSASEGGISYAQSRDFFAQTDSFPDENWGFQTEVVYTNGHYVIRSVGTYRGHSSEVQSDVELGSGVRSVHALYAHALFAGNSSGASNYVLRVGGTGTAADFVRGDTYSGWDIELSGDSYLRLPELLNDLNGDGICDIATDTWVNAFCPLLYSNALPRAEFDAYKASMLSVMGLVYNNGVRDPAEAYCDTIGNGLYEVGEPFADTNGNGVRDLGDSYIDRNGNGVYNAGTDTVVDLGNGQWDAGEEWNEDTAALHHNKRVNGRYDPAGGYWLKSSGVWYWKTARYKVSNVYYYPDTWPAEEYEDVGDGVFQPAETYTDQNGIYDLGEEYVDDRNTIYDYGTQAFHLIYGMPAPAAGQRAALGGDPRIDPPDLLHMFYHVSRTASRPTGALARWGHDVAVTASDYGTAKAITDVTKPEHIFVRNPPTSGSVSSAGKTIQGRTYTALYNTSVVPKVRIDDYFFEDPADTTYNTDVDADSLDGSMYTRPMYIDVRPEHNNFLYYVDGNVYMHHPAIYSLRFRRPGTRITIVAKGNITISDEFYYKADYPAGLVRTNMNSTVVHNPSDALCLIALKNPACADSGNIYIGDRQFGTGGSIHAMLYAENDFVDNNINSTDQQFISVFGNMTAGNHVRLNRQVGEGTYRTRLDVTLDERIRNGEITAPGLPHPEVGQRSIHIDTAWHLVPGTWRTWSFL